VTVYVAWHPLFAGGRRIAKRVYDHFRRELYENVAGGTGLSVLYRCDPGPAMATPLGIDLNESETTALVVLFDKNLVADASYMVWVTDLMEKVDAGGLRARLFPVTINRAAIQVGIAEQAIRWDKWKQVTREEKLRRLTSDLTYQFCRMLRSYVEQLRRPTEDEVTLLQYLRKVQIFLSHSKRDPHGELIAKRIRKQLFNAGGLASFFDVHDIPVGVRFDEAILHQVRVSAVVAIHTDSYSSREWCRREILEAKRYNVPLVVANCISVLDERGFPYMGNVPVVRMNPEKVDRVEYVVARLLDEVLKDFLWQCRVMLSKDDAPAGTVFVPRPPELISLVALEDKIRSGITIVYPDPPLGSEESRLFDVVAPNVQLRSITEWLAQEG
jgi:hypothetical protein